MFGRRPSTRSLVPAHRHNEGSHNSARLGGVIGLILMWLDFLKINNKILRILQNCPIRTHVLELYTKFNLLSLDKLHKHQIILLVFKCLNYAHLLPPLYANYFVLNAEVHDYNTRASTDLHVLGPRSTFRQRCMRYKGGMLWNRLPARLKLPSSIPVLKRKIKTYLSSQ